MALFLFSPDPESANWIWNLPPFGFNFLDTDFRSTFGFSTHAVIGGYYQTNFNVGVKYTGVAWSPLIPKGLRAILKHVVLKSESWDVRLPISGWSFELKCTVQLDCLPVRSWDLVGTSSSDFKPETIFGFLSPDCTGQSTWFFCKT